MEESRRDPKEVEKEAKVNEYITFVKADEDLIGLLGHQPSLRKIRTAYKSGVLTDEHLGQVVAALVNKYDGFHAQPYNNIKEFFNYLKPCLVPATQERDMSPQESKEIIKELLKKHDPKRAEDAVKKFKRQMKKKASVPKINANALPAHLRGLA